MLRLLCCSLFSLSVYASSDNFGEFLQDIRLQAVGMGISEITLDAALDNLTINDKIIQFDRSQAEFSQNFWHYINSRVSNYRLDKGKEALHNNKQLLNHMYTRYGVPPHIIVAFWGLETNYGNYTGNYNLVQSLATLAFDRRRSDFFTKQLLSLLKLIDEGKIPIDSSGSWAGAMGDVQFMPTNVQRYAIDEDGDGEFGLWTSKPDIFSSAANFLTKIGWKNGERWGREVSIPDNFNFQLATLSTKKTVNEWGNLGVTNANGEVLPVSNMSGSVLLPMGYLGPAFLVYDNFSVILNWNRSILYALSVGYLSDRLINMEKLIAKPIAEPPMSRENITYIQLTLNEMGFDAGKPDGMSGPKTRNATRQYQSINGIPADGYVGQTLLKQLTPVDK
ncbi:MAG TPA: lytic murein transglycosylase [Candidatus Thioglobus sp.]|nr:lytic murein transglycosylase [Candidatus Thioglobus sp.]